MKKLILAAAAAVLISGAAYADTIKIGVVGPFSGPFAIQGKNFKAGIDAYMPLNGDKVGDDTIEIIYRDVPQADPAQSKALAQELVVKEGVQYLAGFYFTPDAMAVTPMLKQANVPMVIMNAATSAIVTKSPLSCAPRSPLGRPRRRSPRSPGNAASRRSLRSSATMVRASMRKTLSRPTSRRRAARSSNAIRMPLSTNDFSPIMQRIKDSGAQAVFAFLPSGPTTLGFVKAYNENGLKEAGIKFFAPGDLTQESDLPALGDAAVGIQTTFHYSLSHDSAGEQEPSSKPLTRRSATRPNSPSRRSAPMTACMSSTR